MARIDFYILEVPRGPGADRFVCRLTARARQADHRIFIQVDNDERGDALDEMLWTFSDVSFLPHARAGSEGASSVPVVIGTAPHPGFDAEVIINLTGAPLLPVPPDRRVLEIVADDEADKEAGRARYRAYQAAGYAPEIHQVAAHG